MTTEEERRKKREYMREWTKRNREKCNERAREYRASLSPEEKKRQCQMRINWANSRSQEEKDARKKQIRDYMRAKRATVEGAEKAANSLLRYKLANREKINARSRERRKNFNSEQRAKKAEADRKHRSKWSPERKELDRLRHLSQRQANPDRHNANNQRRRALKKGNGGSYTAQEWGQLKERYGHRCLCCGKPEPEIKLTVDHVIPISKRGSNDIGNIQPLCYSCNASKQDRAIDYRLRQVV
jgi:5-methylcytosine-specific restriction endonuclease McrA